MREGVRSAPLLSSAPLGGGPLALWVQGGERARCHTQQVSKAARTNQRPLTRNRNGAGRSDTMAGGSSRVHEAKPNSARDE
jgi:hypothetical protein